MRVFGTSCNLHSLYPYYPIFTNLDRGLVLFVQGSPGDTDTERFKLLNSVSYHSRSHMENN